MRDPTDSLQLPYERSYDHAAIAATGTIRIDKVPSGMTVRIDDVRYLNPTGFAVDNTNDWMLQVMKNGTTEAFLAFNTDGNDVPAGATLAADTWTIGTKNATDANAVLAGGDTLDLVFTKEGAPANLPAGRIVIRGRYV